MNKKLLSVKQELHFIIYAWSQEEPCLLFSQLVGHKLKVLNLSGRCNITVYVDIPVDTELAAPLAEHCIWRQVRGSGAEVSGSDGPDTTTEKVKTCSFFFFFAEFASCFF